MSVSPGCGCTCRERVDRQGPTCCRLCVSLRQSTLLAGMVSVVFSLLIFAHEVALEGGFNLRNYVVLAFCIVWLIVTSLLVLGTCKRAHFLLLPWMILTCVLTPLIVVGIVAGCKVVASCLRGISQNACVHEYHLFGSNDHTSASIKLGVLLLMFLLNTVSFLAVYKYFMQLSSNDSRKREEDAPIGREEHPSAIRYERFQDDVDPETNVPLCENCDDTRETIT